MQLLLQKGKITRASHTAVCSLVDGNPYSNESNESSVIQMSPKGSMCNKLSIAQLMDFSVILFRADIQTHNKKWNHGSHLHIEKIFILFLPMYTSQLTAHRAMGTQQNRGGWLEYQETLLSLCGWWSTDTGCPEAMEYSLWRSPKAAGMWCGAQCSRQLCSGRGWTDRPRCPCQPVPNSGSQWSTSLWRMTKVPSSTQKTISLRTL